MKRSTRLVVLAAVALTAVGAGAGALWYRDRSPVGAWRKLREAGCSGDVQSFMQRVDRSSVARGLVGDSPLARALAGSAFTEWEDDIKRGSTSEVCQWVLVDSAESYVRFVTRSGESVVARFEKYDDRWTMVELLPER